MPVPACSTRPSACRRGATVVLLLVASAAGALAASGQSAGADPPPAPTVAPPGPPAGAPAAAPGDEGELIRFSRRTTNALAPSPLPPAPTAVDVVLRTALSKLGVPYRYGAAGPDRFDCSGLTMWAWGAAGVDLPHNAASQYASLPHVR